MGLILAVIFAWLVSKSTRLVVDTTQYMPLFLLLIPTMILDYYGNQDIHCPFFGTGGGAFHYPFSNPNQRTGGAGLYIHCHCHWTWTWSQPGAGHGHWICCGSDRDATGNVQTLSC